MKKNFKTKSKNRKDLESFTDFCIENSDLRFWQALRNWSKYEFIYASKTYFENSLLKDTFYLDDYKIEEE